MSGEIDLFTENIKQILSQVEGMIKHVTNMKVTEDSDLLLSELNNVHADLSRLTLKPTPDYCSCYEFVQSSFGNRCAVCRKPLQIMS